MVIKTHIAHEHLKLINSNYNRPDGLGDGAGGHGPKFVELIPIESGTENSNYFLIDENGGKVVMTIFEDRIDDYGIRFCIALQNFLAESGLRVPSCYINSEGEYTTTLPRPDAKEEEAKDSEHKKFALFKFLHGVRRGLEGLSLQDMQSIGKGVAEMHKASQGFDMVRDNPFDINFCKHTLDNLNWGKHPEYRDTLQKGLDFIQDKGLLEAHGKLLPVGVIHTDLFEDNIFFESDSSPNISGFIDFYFSCSGFLCYDIATALVALCFDEKGRYYADRLHHFLLGYNSVRPLLAAEAPFVPLFGVLASCRFLSTRSISLLKTYAKTADPMGCGLRCNFIMENFDNILKDVTATLG